jgi:hypothetical protein
MLIERIRVTKPIPTSFSSRSRFLNHRRARIFVQTCSPASCLSRGIATTTASLKMEEIKLTEFETACSAQYPREWNDNAEKPFPELLSEFRPFQQWKTRLASSLRSQKDPSHTFHSTPYRLRSITLQARDMFGPKRIGFLKLQSEITNDDGEWLPGAVFLRGTSVAMLVRLTYFA